MACKVVAGVGMSGGQVESVRDGQERRGLSSGMGTIGSGTFGLGSTGRGGWSRS